MSQTDPYKVLGLPPSATIAEIRAAYNGILHKIKQDGSTDEIALARFDSARAAYKQLSEGELVNSETKQSSPAIVVPSQIAGFWRRLFAFILDILILGLLGACIGFFLYDYLASIGGWWGRIIGFPIALTYFGVMDSHIRNGQTIGKMVMNIRVISNNGEPLGVAASFCRAGIICIPYFLDGAPFDIELLTSWIGYILAFLVFGIGFPIIYLSIFNRKTRQSLHDLAVGSYVVKTGFETSSPLVAAIWRGHFVAVAVLMAAIAFASIFAGQLAKTEPFASLVALQKTLAIQPGVRYVSVMAGTTSFASFQNGSHSNTNLVIHALTNLKDKDHENLANKLAQIVLSDYAEANKKDTVAVSVSYGYDIGIASSWRTQNFAFSPALWRERLTKFNRNSQSAVEGIIPVAYITSTTSSETNKLSEADQKIYDDASNLINQYNGIGNQLETAYKMLVDLANRNPKSGYPYAALADLKFRMGDNFSESLALAQRALSLDQNIADAYVVETKVLIIQKNINAAQEAANKAIALAPNKPESMFAMARAAEAFGRYEESERWYHKTIDAYQDNIRKSNCYFWLGRMLSNKTPKDITGAGDAFTKAAELGFDSSPWTLNNSANFFIYYTDRYDQAIGYIEQALKLMDFAAAHKSLGIAEYYKWGDSILHPEKYKTANRQPLSPEAITAKTGVMPDYVFVMNADDILPYASMALLKRGYIKNVDVVPPGTTSTALIHAATSNNFDLVKLLVAKGANVNSEDKSVKTTAIIYAVSQNNFDMVKFLVKNGARLNQTDSRGYSVAAYALNQRIGKPASILQYLLQNGADPTIPDKSGSTLIVNAVSGNDVEAVRLLVNKYHADVNAKYFKTPILSLAANGTGWAANASVTKCNEIVKILLNAGANPWIMDGDADLVTKMMLPKNPNDPMFSAYKENAALIMEARKSVPKPRDFGNEYQPRS